MCQLTRVFHNVDIKDHFIDANYLIVHTTLHIFVTINILFWNSFRDNLVRPIFQYQGNKYIIRDWTIIMLPKMNLTPALLLDRERLSLRHSLSLSLSNNTRTTKSRR
jgi:hypothetical protein